MFRRTWNAFLDAIEGVIEFVDGLTGAGRCNKFEAPQKPESRV